MAIHVTKKSTKEKIMSSLKEIDTKKIKHLPVVKDTQNKLPDTIKKYMTKFFPIAMWKVMIGYERYTDNKYTYQYITDEEFEKYHKAGKSAISHLDSLISAEKKSKKELSDDELSVLMQDIKEEDLELALKAIEEHEKNLIT